MMQQSQDDTSPHPAQFPSHHLDLLSTYPSQAHEHKIKIKWVNDTMLDDRGNVAHLEDLHLLTGCVHGGWNIWVIDVLSVVGALQGFHNCTEY